MFPQVLLISQNSRLRRLYHHAAEAIECEIRPCTSIADALLQLVMTQIQVIIIEESIPMFEVTVFLDILAKKPEWNKAHLVAIGFEGQGHIFPQHTKFCTNESQFVSLLKDICATL